MTNFLPNRVTRLIVVAFAVAGFACESAPAAPFPVGIELRVNPPRTWYRTGQPVSFQAYVVDQLGEQITEDITVQWTVDPATSVSGTPAEDTLTASYTMDTEGTVRVEVCVVPAEEGLAPYLCDSASLRVDDGQPSLEVTSPTPGEELTGDEEILVRGSVADRSMVRVYVNGHGTEPDAMGNFSVTIPPIFGVNHIDVYATDGLTDAPSVEMDVLWAPAYSSAVGGDGTPEVVLNDGLELWLGQDFWDDRSRLDLSADPLITEDLADVLELVIASVDLTSLIPDPVADVTGPPQLYLRATNLVAGSPQVEIDLTEDGADLFIRVGAVSADTEGVVDFGSDVDISLDGMISASVIAYAHLNISKESEEAPLDISLSDLTVGVESVEGDFADPVAAAALQLLGGPLRSTIEGLLIDTIGTTLEDAVPALLTDTLNSIDTALANQEIVLDQAPLPPVTIQIDGAIGQIATRYVREMQATMRLTTGTTSTPVHPDSRGVARLDEFDFTPPFINEGSMQVGVRIALLNGLLHALWNSGMLNIDASAFLPSGIESLVTSANIEGQLPPVIRPPQVHESYDLILSLGQFELALNLLGEDVRYGVSIDAGVNVTVADNKISIDVAETPVVYSWAIVPPSNPATLSPESVTELLEGLWPMLRESLVGGLEFELPIPALGDLGGLAPSLSTFQLQLQGGEPRVRESVLVLDVRLEGTLVP